MGMDKFYRVYLWICGIVSGFHVFIIWYYSVVGYSFFVGFYCVMFVLWLALGFKVAWDSR